MRRKTSLILVIIIAMLLSFGSQALAMTIVKAFGLNYGPYTKNGEDPNKNPVIDTDRFYDHMNKIYLHTNWVRTFSCLGNMENFGPIAQSFGLYVAAGAWLGKDKNANLLEMDALVATCQRGEANVAIIGSEALHRGDITAEELLWYIAYFRQRVPGFPVVVADIYSVLAANPAVVNACDAVMINIYPYWEGIDIMDAAAHTRNVFYGFQEQFPNKLVVIGETGWPSAGNTIGKAVADPIYAAWYFWMMQSWAKTEGIIIFTFEAFDEPWKAAYEGPQGAHWGLWDQDGILKAYMEYGFSEYIAPAEYWGGKINPPDDGNPRIEFTHVPPIGSYDNLKGKTYNVSPDDYAVAVYIYVNGWWTKPTFAQPLTPIVYDGTFTCDITTGGSDTKATKITAFVITKGYSPPALGGSASLPAELNNNSIASIEINR